MQNEIEIWDGRNLIAKADAVLVAPHDAPLYPDRLTCLVSGSDANAKHTYHALSQIGLYDFEDKILQVEEIPRDRSLTVRLGDRENVLESGLILLRTLDGKIRSLAHAGLDARKLLVFTNRQCTRWIRLDI